MNLKDLAAGAATIGTTELGLPANVALTREVPTRLGELGLLDPPADGKLGPVSRWALGELKLLTRSQAEQGIGPATAKALLDHTRETLFPTGEGSDPLANCIVRHMRAQGHWLAMHPACRNIVYVEGMNPDGTLNDDKPNVFNDLRIVLSFIDGVPSILGLWEATTEPGEHYTIQPMNPKGAARIAFGEYKAWSVGIHGASSGAGHEALVQTGEIKVHRDLNKDFQRAGDAIDVGDGFAINQHWGYDHPVGNIGKASAGCLVGRTKDGHREFMALVKDDPRFKASSSYKFRTVVIDGSKMA